MKKLAIAMILCLSAASGFSQCRTDRVSAHKEKQLASSVIVGTVTAASPVPEAWDFLDGVNYTVRIDAKIHGKARANTEVTVFSEHSEDGFNLQSGKQYLLFLNNNYQHWIVNKCGNSGPLDEETSVIKQMIHTAGND